MFTLLAVSLFISHVFSLFLSSFFSFHISSPYVWLSLCLFTLSLVLPLLIPFLKNSLFIYFFQKKKDLLFHLFIPFCKSVFVPSPLLFRPFSCLFLFFQSCSFEQDKLTFSLGRKTTCLIPPRTYFLNFC